jgi:hypothetical protein
MADFTVRIELHGAVAGDYDTLHEQMERGGFRRYIAGASSDGGTGIWQLPTAEYDFSSSSSAAAVRDYAKGIADTVRNGAWCLVTQVDGTQRAWFTKKIA